MLCQLFYIGKEVFMEIKITGPAIHETANISRYSAGKVQYTLGYEFKFGFLSRKASVMLRSDRKTLEDVKMKWNLQYTEEGFLSGKLSKRNLKELEEWLNNRFG